MLDCRLLRRLILIDRLDARRYPPTSAALLDRSWSSWTDRARSGRLATAVCRSNVRAHDLFELFHSVNDLAPPAKSTEFCEPCFLIVRELVLFALNLALVLVLVLDESVIPAARACRLDLCVASVLMDGLPTIEARPVRPNAKTVRRPSARPTQPAALREKVCVKRSQPWPRR